MSHGGKPVALSPGGRPMESMCTTGLSACVTGDGSHVFPLPVPEPFKMFSGLSRGSGQRLGSELRELVKSLNIGCMLVILMLDLLGSAP